MITLKKHKTLYVRWTLASILSVVIALYSLTSITFAQEDDDILQLELNQVYHVIKQFHVEGIPDKTLTESAIQAMIEQLNDPYTVYFTSEEYSQFIDTMDQTVVGIGVRVVQDENGILVLEVLENSPALAGGMQEDDYIVGVDGENIVGQALEVVTGKIKGEEGTAVKVTVLREGETIELEFIRKGISVSAIESTWMDGGIGYISVSSFSSNGGQEFTEHLNRLTEKGIQSLILDLRDNSGGVLETARQMAQNFIEDGVLIQTVDRIGMQNSVMIADGNQLSVPVIVLVNEMSASAAEVLAGAIQDHEVGLLLGAKTYGKGSVQSLYRLATGAALKVTTEYYFTPNGNPVDEHGLTPDVIVEGSLPQLMTAVNRSLQRDQTFSLTIAPKHILVNDSKFRYSVPYIEEDGQVYVPSRVLAALVGTSLQWIGDEDTVMFANETKSASFYVGEDTSVSNHAGLLRDGLSFINMDQFVQQFPRVSWEIENDHLHIKAIK